jgi:osmotically-inducible protein OsmY
MRLRQTGSAVLTAALCLTLWGCTTDDEDREAVNTIQDAGVSDHDEDLHEFLPDYVDDDELFTDNQLDYNVENGVVRVRGDVDNDAERERLIERVRRVPGVREVNADAVTIRKQ